MTLPSRTVRKRMGGRFSGVARRGTAWDDSRVAATVGSGASTTGQLLVENVADPEKRGCTLVRMILDLSLVATPPGAVSGMQRLSIGIGLVSDDAFSASAFPEPSETDDFPVGGWIYRGMRLIRDETLASGIIAQERLYLDLRVQRKLERSSVVFMTKNDAVEGSTFSVAVQGLVRSLYKLP